MRTVSLVAAGAIVAATMVPARAETPRPEAADQTLGMALMSAVVNADGTLARGAGAVSSKRILEGDYEVIFSRDVTACTYVASAGSSEVPTWGDTIASAAQAAFDARGARVSTRVEGNPVDRPFHLIVFCGR